MAKYDPNKKYRWNPEDKFELDGEQFGMILNAFRSTLNTPEAQRIIMIYKANDAVEKMIEKAVENDIVKEVNDAIPNMQVKK